MEQNYDVVVIGDGFIARMISYRLEQDGLSVVRLCPVRRRAASWAAAAMLNVDCELEYHTQKQPEHRTKLAYSRYAVEQTKEQLKRLYDEVEAPGWFEPFLQTNGTTLWVPDGHSRLEQDNFLTCYRANDNSDDFPNEWSVDIPSFMAFTDAFYSDDTVYVQSYELDQTNKTVIIDSGDYKIGYGKLVFAIGAGWKAKEPLPLPRKIIYNKGIGLQMRLPEAAPWEFLTDVMRTANRGARCGFHIVRQRSNYIHVGATAEITDVLNEEINIPKVYSLISQLSSREPDIFERAHDIFPYVGHRPLSLDGFPIIGPLDKDTFLVTGTHREGITISGGIAMLVLCWVLNLQNTTLELDYLKLTDPYALPNVSYEYEQFRDIVEDYVTDTGKDLDYYHFDEMMEKFNAHIPEMAVYYLKKLYPGQYGD